MTVAFRAIVQAALGGKRGRDADRNDAQPPGVMPGPVRTRRRLRRTYAPSGGPSSAIRVDFPVCRGPSKSTLFLAERRSPPRCLVTMRLYYGRRNLTTHKTPRDPVPPARAGRRDLRLRDPGAQRALGHDLPEPLPRYRGSPIRQEEGRARPLRRNQYGVGRGVRSGTGRQGCGRRSSISAAG
jgi:hypothetical protein